MHPVTDLAAFLVGTWRVTRRIEAVYGVEGGRFDGMATVRGDDSGTLVYDEQGTVRVGDHVGTATRRLLFQVRGPEARVRFADGRPFHDLDLSAGTWEVVHPCAADRYRGRFTVTHPDAWEQRWRMRGPTEAYELCTTLVRTPCAPAGQHASAGRPRRQAAARPPAADVAADASDSSDAWAAAKRRPTTGAGGRVSG